MREMWSRRRDNNARNNRVQSCREHLEGDGQETGPNVGRTQTGLVRDVQLDTKATKRLAVHRMVNE